MVTDIVKRAALSAAATLAGVMAAGASEVTVMQFNVWQEGTVVPGGFEAIADEIARLNPDFVTLSETRNYKGTRFCDRIVAALAERGREYHSFYSYDSGLLSRHAITDSATIFPHSGDHGTVYKLAADVNGRRMAVYTAHLDYQNDTYYEVRGYDGNDWHRLAAPLTDPDSILARNALSLREEAVAAFLADAAAELERGSAVILGGDFNEPSGADWTEATAHTADHHGVVLDWPCTAMLRDAGYVDAYRAVYPDPLTHPGYTYPSDNASLPPGRITWAPEADERERIDYVYYHPGLLRATQAAIVGPRGTIVRNSRHVETGDDPFIEPLGVWPTDHKAVWVRLELHGAGGDGGAEEGKVE